ncbi:hypothetical protein [Streptococcus pluranimalium]|uniref:hypothetical protein n=1 Tax=Streptococcus pluranimalium TaxID=82348 RepID=UPI003F68DC5A
MDSIRKILCGDMDFIPKPKLRDTPVIVFSRQERFNLFLFEARDFAEVFDMFSLKEFEPYKYTAWAIVGNNELKLFDS